MSCYFLGEIKSGTYQSFQAYHSIAKCKLRQNGLWRFPNQSLSKQQNQSMALIYVASSRLYTRNDRNSRMLGGRQIGGGGDFRMPQGGRDQFKFIQLLMKAATTFPFFLLTLISNSPAVVAGLLNQSPLSMTFDLQKQKFSAPQSSVASESPSPLFPHGLLLGNRPKTLVFCYGVLPPSLFAEVVSQFSVVLRLVIKEVLQLAAHRNKATIVFYPGQVHKG